MPQINITINSNNSSANGSGNITDPALIEAALAVLDAIRDVAAAGEAVSPPADGSILTRSRL